METEKSNCCCDWKVAAITVGCVEFLLSIGLGIVFGAANLIIDDLFAAIVIILICSEFDLKSKLHGYHNI